MAVAKLFDFVSDLSYGKKRLIDQDPDNEKAINQFMINRAMSQGYDTVMYANEMNKATGIDNRMFYDYYHHVLRKKKRWNKWAKKGKMDFVADVIEYFEYSYPKAVEAIGILTIEQLERIHKLLDKGGKRR
jgi:hypothetical protein